MHWLQKNQDYLLFAWRWLRDSRWSIPGAALVSVLIILICQAFGYHELFRPGYAADDVHQLQETAPAWIHFLDYLRPYLRLSVLLGSVVFALQLARVFPNWQRMVVPTWILSGAMLVQGLLSEAYLTWQEDNFAFTGEPKSSAAYIGKLVMLVIIALSPPVAVGWYARRSLLERYTLRAFVQPLVFCFVAFAAIFILMDLIDCMRDFQEAGTPLSTIAQFYFNLLPYIYVYVAPAAVLLAMLYSLTKMSRANEIVSMLTAGRSLGQILRPLYIVAIYASVVGMAANYYWAPHGESGRAALVRASKDKQTGTTSASSVMYRNEETHRTWFVSRVPFDLVTEKIRYLEVHQMDEKGRITRGWFSSSARWLPGEKAWVLYNGVEATYHKGETVNVSAFPEFTGGNRLIIRGWPETPWSLISASLLPDTLTVPELASYLNANQLMAREKLGPFQAQFFQRFARSWQCLVIALLAGPLAIAFSRRGALGGIAVAVGLFFGMMFLENLFMSLAKGGRVPAWLAVWLPHLLLIGLAAWLFDRKSQNKDALKVNFPAILDWFKQWRLRRA